MSLPPGCSVGSTDACDACDGQLIGLQGRRPEGMMLLCCLYPRCVLIPLSCRSAHTAWRNAAPYTARPYQVLPQNARAWGPKRAKNHHTSSDYVVLQSCSLVLDSPFLDSKACPPGSEGFRAWGNPKP